MPVYPRLVNLVRLVWILIVAWYELGTFHRHTSSCTWPDGPLVNSGISTVLPTHVLVVADPQILDHRSYPDRSPWLVRLSQFIVDLNLRKGWRAAMRQQPHAVVFLGDMMDNGRFDMPDAEYESYFRRFKSIFAADQNLPIYYLPGNHDVGLGASSPRYQFSADAVERYISHFSDLNQHITIANHTVWLIDAPGLVNEDRERVSAGMSHAQWADTHPDGTIAFLQPSAQGADPDYTEGVGRPILFTHVPLSRPEGSLCGPLRERGTIRQGKGFGYQNLLSAQVSQLILQNIRPAVVFSGDDHDYCEYVHTVPSTDAKRPSPPLSIPEITVKSFSMAMGIRRPGYQFLSLVPPTASRTDPTFAHRPCLLPDQLGIYLSIYIPLISLTLIFLLISNIRRKLLRSTARDDSAIPLNSADSDGINFDLPPPSAWRSKQFPRAGWSRLWTWTFTIGGQRRRITISSAGLVNRAVAFLWTGSGRDNEAAYRRASVLRGFLRDFRDAAWAPLGLSVAIAWWVW